MFNLGLFELGLFGVIALIVLGPKLTTHDTNAQKAQVEDIKLKKDDSV